MTKQRKDYIAYTRLTPAQKASLDTIVAALPGEQSAHIRAAVDLYIARLLPTLASPPAVVPAAADPAGETVPLREAGQ